MHRCHIICNSNRMNYIKPILYIFLLLTVSTYTTCPDNCDDCDESGMICFTCIGDYQVNVFGGCHANTIDKCIIYGPSDQCFRCQPTYSLVNGACVKNFNGCVNEGNPNQCFECAFGLTLSGSTCSGVINCADFSGGKCNKCKEGFTLTQKICKDTSDACASIRPTDGICNKCKDGYFQSGYQCFKQKQRNKRCYVQDLIDKCPYCKSGYNGIDGKCLRNKQMSGLQSGPSSADYFYQSSEGDPFGYGNNGKSNQFGDIFSSGTGFPQTTKIDHCQVPDPMGNGCKACVYGWFSENKGCQPVSPLCDGYNLQTGQCFACTNQLTLDSGKCIDKNCEQFNNNACLVCKTGYKANQNNVCQVFDSNCLDSQKGKCQKCKQDFYIDISGLCKALPPFCLTANVQTGSCLQCVKDYQIVSPGAPCTKKIFIENCRVYDTKNVGKCLICLQQYYPDDKKCSKVSKLCKEYNPQNGNCISCAIQGFILGNGICLDQNCLSRSNDEVCTNCKTNFIFNNSEKICKLNDPNCKNTAISSCLQCKTDFYITNQKICKALPLNCQTADATGKCMVCLDRFYNSDSSCQPVSTTCNGYNAVNGKCTSCNSNLVLQSDGTCAVAIQIISPFPIQLVNQKPNLVVIPQITKTSPISQITTTSNINTVKKSDLNCRQYNGNKCIKCSNRYYVGINERCIPVNPLCKQSNSAGQCTLCYLGYKIDTGKCIIAQFNDPNCKNFLNQQCSQCYRGFYFNQNDKICKKLNPLCKTSNLFNGFCTSCYNGYNVNSSSGNCQIFLKDWNCKQFNPDGNNCKLCSNRYYVNTNGKCSAANPLCKNFNLNTGACTDCYPGYGLKNNLCVAGVSSHPNCKNPEGTGCEQCLNGFYLNNEGKCTQASPLCKTFDKKNGNCLSCYNGYTILNGVCIISQTQDLNCKKANCSLQKAIQNSSANDPNCIKLNKGICTQCLSGYYYNRDQGLCAQFDPICKTSDTNSGACQTCYQGYIIKGKQCIPVSTILIPNCLIVGPSGQCAECVEGNYLNKQKNCVKVSILCAGYNKQTGDCTSCVTGYFLQGNSCVFPSIYDPNCSTYENSYCSKCAPGFYLSNFLCINLDPNCKNFNFDTLKCEN